MEARALCASICRGSNAASIVCIQYLKVPVRWLAGDDLLESKKEAVLENFYGQHWRRGNEDGSAYIVHSFKTDVLRAEETHTRVWLQKDDRATRYWYYHVTEDGHFKSVERDTF